MQSAPVESLQPALEASKVKQVQKPETITSAPHAEKINLNVETSAVETHSSAAAVTSACQQLAERKRERKAEVEDQERVHKARRLQKRQHYPEEGPQSQIDLYTSDMSINSRHHTGGGRGQGRRSSRGWGGGHRGNIGKRPRNGRHSADEGDKSLRSRISREWPLLSFLQ